MQLNSKIGFVCPCKVEYKSCRDNLNLDNEKQVKGRTISFLNRDKMQLIAILAGPGKIQCASAAQLLIDKYNLDYIIDVGAAGSLSNDVKIFDTICVERAYEYDVLNNDFNNIPRDLITKTDLHDNPKMKEVIEGISKEPYNIRIGNIACGEMNVNNKRLRKKLYQKLGAIGANWETSAVLKVAELNNMKSLSFRVITDQAGEAMEENLMKNWEEALDILFQHINDFINIFFKQE